MSSTIKNILFLVSFVLIVWFGYIIFFKDSADTTAGDQVTSAAILDQQNFLLELKQLRDLQLKPDLFVDPEFISLTDQRVDVVDEPAGRPDPFAPVPGLIKKKDQSKK